MTNTAGRGNWASAFEGEQIGLVDPDSPEVKERRERRRRKRQNGTAEQSGHGLSHHTLQNGITHLIRQHDDSEAKRGAGAAIAARLVNGG